MVTSMKRAVLAALLAASLVGGAGVALSQDREAIVKERRATMKRIGDDLAAIKAYLDGKVDQARALEAALDLSAQMKRAAEMFPAGTGMTEFPGNSGARPVIWTENAKFTAAHAQATAKGDALVAAVRNGDKQAIQAAFEDMGKNGCGNCHTTFREKI